MQLANSLLACEYYLDYKFDDKASPILIEMIKLSYFKRMIKIKFTDYDCNKK